MLDYSLTESVTAEKIILGNLIPYFGLFSVVIHVYEKQNDLHFKVLSTGKIYDMPVGSKYMMISKFKQL
jgi:hypothetical protein